MSNSIARIARIAKVLEDRFFFAENIRLKEQLARLKREEENAEALSKVSGIINKSVLNELVALGIRPELLAALCLVPIIEVAWADGAIDEQERTAVLQRAQKHGFSQDHAILQEWLQHKPDALLMDAWRSYMRGLSEILSTETLVALKNDILEHTKNVAIASGGFLGLTNPISPAETAVLDAIELFFKQSCSR
ncbi:MAG: hypothetical protein JW795_23985 [Chitinivibrionales bacterium]|nr:hypothetical protein [Chitinivibrionales bacterium]